MESQGKTDNFLQPPSPTKNPPQTSQYQPSSSQNPTPPPNQNPPLPSQNPPISSQNPSPPSQHLMEKWLICVDPDSNQIYTLNINTNVVCIEKEVDYYYREKAKKAVIDIEELLKLKQGLSSLNIKGTWLTASKQIDKYRRRKIPSYLLHKQSSSISTYLCQSTLSLAFANVNSIKLHVKLNKYKQLFFEMSTEAMALDQPNIIEIEAGLVTGADEVIKNVLREVYLRFKIKLKPNNDNNQFILQIAGLKEFLTGNHPMLSYDRVRISLRGMKHLEVILTEVPKQSDKIQLFPPIITRQSNSEKKDFEKIDWSLFIDVPVLLWYAPVPLEQYKDDMRNTDYKYNSRISFQNSQMQKLLYDIKGNQSLGGLPVNISMKSYTIDPNNLEGNIYAINRGDRISGSLDKSPVTRQETIVPTCRLRTTTKDRVNDLVSMKNELQKRNLLTCEQNVHYSGECDWPFSIRICAIENIMQILESDVENLKQYRATFNGQISPLYITKQGAKAEEKKDQQHEEDTKKLTQQKQVHLKLYKRYAGDIEVDPTINLSTYKKIAFGGQEHSADIQFMQKKYGLDLIPYLISIQASIYHGCKLITSWCQTETRKVPFSTNPKFYQTLTFPGIKISMLPQEARLCFNIIVHSSSGQTQILGSTTMYIFDEQRRFRSSINSLNIWPYYKVDPRLLCMGQYWGLTNPEEKRPESVQQLKQFVNNKYGKMLVQMDQFSQPMKWSLRDEKQMEELGFSKSAKGQRYFQMKNNLQTQTQSSLTSTNLNQDQTANDQFGSQQQIDPSHLSVNSNLVASNNSKKKQTNNGNSSGYSQSLLANYMRPHIMQSPGGAYDGYLYAGLSQEQGTQIRFDGRDERTHHQFTTSFMHMPQGSSLYLHGLPQQSTSQLSSYKMTQTFSQHSAQQGPSSLSSDFFSQVYPYKNWSTTPRTEDLAILQTLLKVNPLNRPYYTDQHKFILMICRNHYKTLPYALQIFLMAIEWDDPEQVREGHNMIKLWTPLPPEDALPLLDAPFADETVRLYAVERVSILSDDELALYMLELTQGLMFEKLLFNPLAEMLLERSLQNPWVVGHELFWLLRSQLHVKPQYERYALLLEQMLMLCGQFREDLLKEVLVNDELNNIAQAVKVYGKENKQDPKLANAFLHSKLPNLQLPKAFSFALDSRMEAKEFIIEDCKVMNSKKQPLWLAVKSNCEDDDDFDFKFKLNQDEMPRAKEHDIHIPIINEEDQLNNNDSKKESDSEGKNIIQIIFKNGDDIRQDLLTLQLIKIMDKIWLDAGMDFRMKPYKVIATQDQVGMIEVVSSSRTTEKIHAEHGMMGAFQTKSIWNYLKKKNKEPQSFEIATDNFFRSCAGYCVATYILGIGDRHSGNIMLTDTGHLFHIDFGHFLGNFKKKLGIKRERAKFVLTEEMAFVMGGREGDLFKKFQSDCTTAYNMVRKHGHFLINIFLMNLSAGMPELQQTHNVHYLEEMLALNISDQEAIARFKQEIIASLNDTWRTIDNFFHNMKRRE